MAVVVPDPRRHTMALILAGRYFARPNAPFGVQGGSEVGPAYIRRYDPDMGVLLRGTRQEGLDLSAEVWPTLQEVKDSLRLEDTANDAQLQGALDAAIAVVTGYCSSLPVGIA